MTTSSQADAPKNKHFLLTQTKRKTLALLAEYFCLRPIDLAPLIYGKLTAINRISMNRTLRILRQQRFVSRLPYLDMELERGPTYVYGLTDKALAMIEDAVIYSSEYAKTFDEHSQRTLDHELEISLFHIALKKFCEKNGLELFWRQTELKKKTIAPDAYFAITDPKKPEGHNTFHYFLEIERSKFGKMKNGEYSIMRKLGKFYAYYNSADCEKEWHDFKQFRVIIVQRNDTKRNFLLSSLKEKYSHKMFWLTTESLVNENIGGEIFLTPKDHEQKSYSFLIN